MYINSSVRRRSIGWLVGLPYFLKGRGVSLPCSLVFLAALSGDRVPSDYFGPETFVPAGQVAQLAYLYQIRQHLYNRVLLLLFTPYLLPIRSDGHDSSLIPNGYVSLYMNVFSLVNAIGILSQDVQDLWFSILSLPYELLMSLASEYWTAFVASYL